MEKKTYYIDLASKEISQMKNGNNTAYAIHATDKDIDALRSTFNQMGDAEIGTYIRSHIPFVLYHKDSSNDQYDAGLHAVIAMIYELATPSTKQAMEEAGIIPENETKR